jgi:hypothetical protein
VSDDATGLQPAADPPPLEPRRPESQECCDSGCDPCVFDLYAQAMEEYEAALAAWKLRQSGRGT